MKPKRFVVVGDPIKHSKSPAMHQAAFRTLGMPHTYEALRVARTDLKNCVARLRNGEFDGINVTLPYKTSVLEFVDSIDKTVEAVGAANTLVREEDGSIRAYNTDVAALGAELSNVSPELTDGLWRESTALVLGAGGAARSAIAALGLSLSVKRIIVRARTSADSEVRNAQMLQDMQRRLSTLGSPTMLHLEPLVPQISDRDVQCIVQATSAGMEGGEDGFAVAAAVSWSLLPVSATVLDVIYNPEETPFLRAATDAGLRATNGIGMLVRQGALAFEHWLHVPAPYNAMLTAIL